MVAASTAAEQATTASQTQIMFSNMFSKMFSSMWVPPLPIPCPGAGPQTDASLESIILYFWRFVNVKRPPAGRLFLICGSLV